MSIQQPPPFVNIQHGPQAALPLPSSKKMEPQDLTGFLNRFTN